MKIMIKPTFFLLFILAISGLVSGCIVDAKTEDNEEKISLSSSSQAQIPAVDVIRVKPNRLNEIREYIGTTQPIRTIVIRSQAEGQILELNFDVGDRIFSGETIARLDDTLLQAEVAKAEAELASLNAQVIQAKAQVESAKAQVESAKATWNQAQIDADRLANLLEEGAISRRQVELARTTEKNALQSVKAAQAEVNVRQAEVEAALGQIITQKALIEAEKKRLAFTEIKAPRDGYVLKKLTESGNLVQQGGEIIEIGDFSQIKVAISVSELDLSKIKPNQAVKIRLDAFPNQTFVGTVSRISPSADANIRQIPVEIVIDNSSQMINSGLLARVNILDSSKKAIVIPETALNVGQNSSSSANEKPFVFVINQVGDMTEVTSRRVTLGKKDGSRVEVIAGLNPQDRLVVRSTQPLENQQLVRLSLISED